MLLPIFFQNPDEALHFLVICFLVKGLRWMGCGGLLGDLRATFMGRSTMMFQGESFEVSGEVGEDGVHVSKLVVEG